MTASIVQRPVQQNVVAEVQVRALSNLNALGRLKILIVNSGIADECIKRRLRTFRTMGDSYRMV